MPKKITPADKLRYDLSVLYRDLKTAQEKEQFEYTNYIQEQIADLKAVMDEVGIDY